MKKLIKNVRIINEGQQIEGDLLIVNDRIEKIGGIIESREAQEVDGKGNYLLPGVIDDQVHFREPGLTHKADIESESRAAVAGGTTTFMEMPNTKPAALTQEELEKKYAKASQVSPANYSFFMGASNENIEHVLKTNEKTVCGVKIFMGSSTGNMLVDDEKTLENLFSKVPMLIATHCEDEMTIRRNTEEYVRKYGDKIPFSAHPEIRSVEACYKSSSLAVRMAKKYDTRLHILHISTAEELDLFTNEIPLAEKRITSEVCVHHLYFDADDYETLGSKVKCNPAVKEARHKKALMEALLDDRLDIIATDHAPHTLEEKQGLYMKAPSGLPLVQHSLNMMLDFYQQGVIGLEKVVEKMSHAPAVCFEIQDRGYVREGYYADLVLVDMDSEWTVSKENVRFKCGWSPLEGKTFHNKVLKTFVNGFKAYSNGEVNANQKGYRLSFNR
ncbi:dihydroorotase [Portibacter lacus]|uniref:Dihydroorotase n=1 Tax=Portibacter lacus TaxID=1099794 RepID=A0AA37WE72_9BACT|nr:dihydroorotase [Portibacter lacus]GLR16439.1 dihydroorotase [Portibacter lacus]